MKAKWILIPIILLGGRHLLAEEVSRIEPVSPHRAWTFSRSIQHLWDSEIFSASGDPSNGLVVGDEPGETMTITDSYTLEGDLTIMGDGILNIEDADFRIDGDIFILGQGQLNVTGGSFTVIQEYIYEHDAVVTGDGKLSFTDVDFTSSGQSWSIGLTGNAAYAMHGSDVSDGFITVGLLEQASASIVGSTTPGEFLCFGENDVEFRTSDFLLFWLVLPDGSTVETTLPEDLAYDSWTFHSEEPDVAGIPSQSVGDPDHEVGKPGEKRQEEQYAGDLEEIVGIGDSFCRQTCPDAGQPGGDAGADVAAEDDRYGDAQGLIRRITQQPRCAHSHHHSGGGGGALHDTGDEGP